MAVDSLIIFLGGRVSTETGWTKRKNMKEQSLPDGQRELSSKKSGLNLQTYKTCKKDDQLSSGMRLCVERPERLCKKSHSGSRVLNIQSILF